ncbi:hypothetical protein [Nocardia sp. BMG111209]|uniref:hypothetical protein n=1 Tax=Nocardia sp. BMG111209 TaxID=1160137 RepID=UPI0018CA3862|nr:hypothetical protein [Nocardia sp. BMG111209]
MTAVLTTALTGIAEGLAHAEPQVAPETAPTALRGVDHGVAFTISHPVAAKNVTVTLDQGRFTPTDTGIVVTDATGTRIGEIPFTVATTHGTVALSAAVDPSGTRLTAEPIDGWISQRDLNGEIGAGVGGLIGFTAGAALGFLGLIGMGVLAIITVPAALRVSLR